MKCLFNRIVCFLFILFLFYTCQKVSAQTYHFRNYSVEHGLPFIQVYTIFQDSKGNLWSGGYGGLSRFDGLKFTNFGPKDGLVNYAVTSIVEDKIGNLWIGTYAGVSCYDGNKFTNYSVKEGLPDEHINYIVTDEQGLVWFGTPKGVCSVNPSANSETDKKFSVFTSKYGLISDNILCVLKAGEGQYWLGSDQGLSFFDGKTYTNYTVNQGLPNNEINALAKDENNNIWIGTSNGLAIFRNNKFTNLNLKHGLPSNRINSITANRAGSVMLGTNNGLVEVIEKDEKFYVKTYSPARDVNSKDIGCLYYDFEGNLWIGSHAGLYRYRGEGFITYAEKDGLEHTFIFQSLRDIKGNLWVCSNGGLYKYNGKKFKRFDTSNGLGDNETFSIVEDKCKNLWIGTKKGVSKYDGKTFTNYDERDGLVGNYNICMFKDSKDNIWIGGRNGVTIYDGKTFTKLPVGNHPQQMVSAILEDKYGDIWIGSYQGGLYKYTCGTLVDMAKALGIKSDAYMAIKQDEQGNIYLGTFDGVFIYDGVTIHQFNEKHGLNSDLVYLMTFDNEEKDLWVGTNQGLNKINLAAFYNSGDKKIKTFGKEEGFTGVECNSAGAMNDVDGSIWFGTVNGLVQYKPNAFNQNFAESKVNITGIRLFYKDTLLKAGSKLHYNLNNITFRFVGICLTNPFKVNYSYKLEGFDKNWSPASTDNFASYSNLPPGKYVFKVQAVNNEGVWNANPIEFAFSIARPFWKSLWFWLSAALISLMLTILAFRLRIKQVKRIERESLQRKIEMASNELKALRSQMNPHFIFNSLNSIQHFIMTSDEESAIKYLHKFAMLIRTILNNSEKATVSVKEELEALNLYLELEKLRFDGKFDYSISVSENIDQELIELPPLLIQPYVENAILHGINPKKAKGNVVISLEKRDQYLICSVIDDGIGRKKSGVAKANSIKHKHKSLGTKITRDRVELLNQVQNSNLSVEVSDLNSESVDCGTKVDIYIPIG